jgi:uncharacterized protein (TIGR02646 family)
MRRFTKGDCPVLIENNWLEWGQRYAANRETNNSFQFQWPTVEGTRINQTIEPVLANDTQNHCSYCDNFPIREQEDSIDHFKPKTVPAFYELVCHWNNLYYCCHNCQMSRGNQYDDLLLRPDSDDYSFTRYFTYNYSNHTINVNPQASDIDKARAVYTLDKFGFNSGKSDDSRRISYERYILALNAGNTPILTDYSFRFIFDLL